MSCAADIKFYSTFHYKERVWGEEEVVENYVVLAEDPISNLTEHFTICSSVFVKFVFLEPTDVIVMLKQDGSPWFVLELNTVTRDYESLSEKMKLIFEDPESGSHDSELFTDTIIPIVPHSWYHICLGLDTVSGLLRIVVNGIKVVNEEKAEFRNTSDWRPGSLDGNILVFKEFFTSFWAQKRGKFSNMNVFAFMISLDDMMMRTSGEADCTGAGDYLSWEEMEWSITGDVDSGTVDTEDLCQR